ncbi:hypothetical protein NDU88_002221, partial [Pleurodeles waltl]
DDKEKERKPQVCQKGDAQTHSPQEGSSNKGPSKKNTTQPVPTQPKHQSETQLSKVTLQQRLNEDSGRQGDLVDAEEGNA